MRFGIIKALSPSPAMGYNMIYRRVIATTVGIALVSAYVAPSYALLQYPDVATAPVGTSNTKEANTSFVSTAVANMQAYIVGLLGGKLSRVANAAALASWTNYAFPVERDDVGVLYIDTGASCVAADGGAQIQPATGHCWKADISGGAPITLWNPPATGDASTAARAGIAALVAANNGGELRLTANANGWLFNSGVQIPSGTKLVNMAGSFIKVGFAAGDVVTLTGQHAEAQGLRFVNAVARTSGAALEINNAEFAVARDTQCRRPSSGAGFASYYCVGIDLGDTNTVENTYVDQEGQSGVCIGCQYGQATDPAVIGNNDIVLQHAAALEVQNTSGLFLRGLNTDFNTHGFWAHPVAGASASAMDVAESYFDLSTKETVLIEGAGQINGNNFHGKVWIATSGSPSSFFPAGTFTGVFAQKVGASGLDIEGLPQSTVDNSFDVHVINCSGPGILLNGGVGTALSGKVTQNGQDVASAGLAVGSGVSDWSWHGRIGGPDGLVASGATTNKQTWGVLVNGGSSDYYTIEGNLNGNVTGGLSDGGSGTHKLTSQILQ